MVKSAVISTGRIYFSFFCKLASKIREQIPGKQYTLPDEDNPVYFPFGMPGGGAPVRDRRGNVITNTFGNFEKKVLMCSKVLVNVSVRPEKTNGRTNNVTQCSTRSSRNAPPDPAF